VRVLVTSTPGTGHLYPLVPMALELRTSGHDVVWATAPESCAAIELLGFPAEPCGLTGAERRRLVGERHLDIERLPARERRQVVAPVMFGEIAAPRMRRDLGRIVDSYRPDVIFHDLLELAAAPIAASRDVSHATLAFGAALPLPLLRAITDSVAHIWVAEGVEPSDSAGIYDHLYLHPLPEGFGGPLPSPVAQRIRPMHFDGAATSDHPEWITNLGIERPFVYVSFGTEVAARAPWLEILEALAAIDADAVATIGSSINFADLGAIPTNVIIERFVPQSYVLRRAAVVVSHAGSGTLLAAAAAGVPQLSMPIAADQWVNADMLALAGAGITMEFGDRDTRSIAIALDVLLGDSRYVEAARALATDFGRLPHPKDLVELIEALA
jgi:hypothetical protein